MFIVATTELYYALEPVTPVSVAAWGINLTKNGQKGPTVEAVGYNNLMITEYYRH